MANWTSIAHLFVVLGQLALFLTATLTFVLGNSTSDDDDWPQLDDFDSQNSSFYVNSTIPWASSAVGAFGLVINLLLWLVLYRADKARMVNLTPTTWGQYKRMTNVASVMMSPFLVGDVAIVAVAGPNSLTSISVVASIAAAAIFMAILVDQVRLRNSGSPRPESLPFYNRCESHSDQELGPYGMARTGNTTNPDAMDSMAPPPYEGVTPASSEGGFKAAHVAADKI